MAEHNPFRHPSSNPHASSSSSRRPSNDDDERDDNPNIDINARATRAHPPQHLQPTGTSIEHPIFGFSNPQANLPMPLANRLPMPRLPPIHALGVPAPLPGTAGGVDLSEISRATLNIPEDTVGFRMSESLRNDILNFEALVGVHTLDSLVQRLCGEAELYANDRKELVRNEMKRIENQVGENLTTNDRTKLRSRREAKVSRTKNQEYERALLSALKWLIRERNNNNSTTNQDGLDVEIYNQIQSQAQQLQLTPAPAAATAPSSGQPSSQQHLHQNNPDRGDKDGDNDNRRIWD